MFSGVEPDFQKSWSYGALVVYIAWKQPDKWTPQLTKQLMQTKSIRPKMAEDRDGFNKWVTTFRETPFNVAFPEDKFDHYLESMFDLEEDYKHGRMLNLHDDPIFKLIKTMWVYRQPAAMISLEEQPLINFIFVNQPDLAQSWNKISRGVITRIWNTGKSNDEKLESIMRFFEPSQIKIGKEMTAVTELHSYCSTCACYVCCPFYIRLFVLLVTGEWKNGKLELFFTCLDTLSTATLSMKYGEHRGQCGEYKADHALPRYNAVVADMLIQLSIKGKDPILQWKASDATSKAISKLLEEEENFWAYNNLWRQWESLDEKSAKAYKHKTKVEELLQEESKNPTLGGVTNYCLLSPQNLLDAVDLQIPEPMHTLWEKRFSDLKATVHVPA